MLLDFGHPDTSTLMLSELVCVEAICYMLGFLTEAVFNDVAFMVVNFLPAPV